MVSRIGTEGSTERAILQNLLRGPSTVEVLAHVVRVDPTVARRHLVNLHRAGLVSVEPQRGERGRPRARYVITVEGREVFYAKYDVVLDALTRGALHRSSTQSVRGLYQDAAGTLAADLRFPLPPPATLNTLRDIGFEPELRTEAGRRVMVSHNCPVLRQARRTPRLLCETFHGGLLERAFPGVRVGLQQTMATGAPQCVHVLTPGRPRTSSDGG